MPGETRGAVLWGIASPRVLSRGSIKEEVTRTKGFLHGVIHHISQSDKDFRGNILSKGVSSQATSYIASTESYRPMALRPADQASI